MVVFLYFDTDLSAKLAHSTTHDNNRTGVKWICSSNCVDLTSENLIANFRLFGHLIIGINEGKLHNEAYKFDLIIWAIILPTRLR